MVGIDIVKISRINEVYQNQKFCQKILNQKEIEYAFSKSKIITKFGFDSIAMTVAGLFAAKEAVLKALQVGMTNGYGFKEILIDHTEKGAPIVVLSEGLERVLKSFKKKQVNLSIAHDGEYATAIATLS